MPTRPRSRPSSATRRSGAWPHQLRLPGQAAAPEGPVDLSMLFLLHLALRRDVAAFAAEVRLVPVDDRGSWRRLARRWTLFATALHHHHAVEDRWLWPALRDRATPDERATLAAMGTGYGDLDGLLEAVAVGLDALAAGAGHDARAALAVRLVAARESLGRHLAHEETDALGIAQARLTSGEWQALEAGFGEGLGVRDLVAMVPWALHGLAEHHRGELLSRSGRLHRVLWRLTRHGFARREARTFAQKA